MPSPSAIDVNDQPQRKVVFCLLRATAAWLRHSVSERSRFVDDVVRPILTGRPGVRVRYFDAEAFSAAVSDVVMWEFHDEREYRALVDDLRETPFWGEYFEVQSIIMAVEEDFARHYAMRPLAERGA